MKVSVYLMNNGDISIRWPVGYTPDRETLERVSGMIRLYRKEAAS